MLQFLLVGILFSVAVLMPVPSDAEQSEKVLAKEIFLNLQDIYRRGVSMEPIRMKFDSPLLSYPQQLQAMRTCGKHMHKNQEFARTVSKKAEALSMDYIYIKVAANPIYTKYCVSCLDDAIESCDELEEAIEEAQHEIQ